MRSGSVRRYLALQNLLLQVSIDQKSARGIKGWGDAHRGLAVDERPFGLGRGRQPAVVEGDGDAQIPQDYYQEYRQGEGV